MNIADEPLYPLTRPDTRVRDTYSHAIRQVLQELGHTDLALAVRCDYASDTTVGFVLELHTSARAVKQVIQADVPRSGYGEMPDFTLAASMLLVQL